MQVVIVHKPEDKSNSLLRFAFSCRQLKNMLVEKAFESPAFRGKGFFLAIPEEWKNIVNASDSEILFYKNEVPVSSILQLVQKKSWFVISNGRFTSRVDTRFLYEAVSRDNCDVVAVNIEPNLRAGCEKVHVDSQRNLYGFRLLYADTVQPAPVPSDWPHYLFIKSNLAEKLFCNSAIPVAFSDFINRCHLNSTTIGGLDVGGTALDLNTEKGLLLLLSDGLGRNLSRYKNGSNSRSLSTGASLFGDITFGQNVKLGENTIIAGPAVIGDEAQIANLAVIRASIIGPDVSVPSGCIIQNRVITDSSQISQQYCQRAEGNHLATGYFDMSDEGQNRSPFRIWPRLSYARCVKRIADVIVSLIVLIIFAPVLPVIALAVKLSSKGPVFFKAIRQGLHGKSFDCVKFRTMLVGADALQEKLRVLNEADGPQFVMTDDPRMSKVGRFLRETYIDEIPQFFAVLLGHMSIVGPRPSPESENVLCPFWRDARLSVRPGITGLWQVCRTRQPMRDFQEWIHYDVEYVRNLSMGLDLWICWQTAKKMFFNFVRQF